MRALILVAGLLHPEAPPAGPSPVAATSLKTGIAEASGLETICRERIEAAERAVRAAFAAQSDAQVHATYDPMREIERACLDVSLDPRLRAKAILVVFRLPERRTPEARARLIVPLEEALAVEAPDSPERIQILEESADIAFQLGELNAARGRVAQALELRRQIYGAESPEAVDGMIYAGMLRFAESQVRDKTQSLNEAREILEEAVAFSSRTLGPRAPATMRAWVSLGGVLRELGDPDAADRIWSAYGEGNDEALDPRLLDPPGACEESSDRHE